MRKKPPKEHVCFRCGLGKQQIPPNPCARMLKRYDGKWVCAPCIIAVYRQLEEINRRIAAEAWFNRCL